MIKRLIANEHIEMRHNKNLKIENVLQSQKYLTRIWLKYAGNFSTVDKNVAYVCRKLIYCRHDYGLCMQETSLL